MNKEVKEILQNISDKFEDYYVQDIVSGNDLKILLDYITNLQEENKILSVELNKNMIERNNYLSRNEKAIEYIEKHTNHFVLGANKEVDEFDYISTSPKALLNILKGEDK